MSHRKDKTDEKEKSKLGSLLNSGDGFGASSNEVGSTTPVAPTSLRLPHPSPLFLLSSLVCSGSLGSLTFPLPLAFTLTSCFPLPLELAAPPPE